MSSIVTPTICAYCGNPAETVDHVVAQCLFERSQNHKPVKVPCCLKCNQTKSKEDEWLRLMLALSEQSGNGTHAQYARKKAVRALQKPEAIGFARSFFKGVRKVTVRSPAGIHLRDTLSYQVDLKRMCKAIEQIALGLFFHETGRRLDPEYVAVARTNETFLELELDLQEMLNRDINIPLARVEPKFINPGAFHYRFYMAADLKDFSAMGLSFYDGVPFLVITMPRGMVSDNIAAVGAV